MWPTPTAPTLSGDPLAPQLTHVSGRTTFSAFRAGVTLPLVRPSYTIDGAACSATLHELREQPVEMVNAAFPRG